MDGRRQQRHRGDLSEPASLRRPVLRPVGQPRLPLKRTIAIAIAAACLAAAWLLTRTPGPPPAPTPAAGAPSPAAATTPPAAAPAAAHVLPVAAEASRLNDPATSAADDLAIVESILDEYRRHLDGNPVGDNNEITAALLGANPKRLACLPADPGRHLDAAGRLIDRWGNPYFFHALSSTRMEIVSAGPDGVLHTGDDIQRGE